MDPTLSNPDDSLKVWHQKDASDYKPAEQGLSVREESVTQTEPGELVVDSALVSTKDAGLFRVAVGLRSMGTTVVDPDRVTFAMPVSWSGELFINGAPARETCVTMPSDEYYVRGGRREIVGIVLKRRPFIETLAALRGIGPEDVSLAEPEFDLSLQATRRLHSLFGAMFAANAETLSPDSINNDLFEWMADAYLSARPGENPGSGRNRPFTRIVRKAEERFWAEEDRSASLADLCQAAGVSKSCLYQAFQAVCGMPPLAYFQKRRLMKARSLLLNSPNEFGAVKRVALSLGLTELGRFSVEYRQLFGESPTATLGRVD